MTLTESAKKHIEEIKAAMENAKKVTSYPLSFYSYIETWNDEGTVRLISDIEDENGEVVENVVGLISQTLEETQEFDNVLRVEMEKEKELFKIWQQNDWKTPVYTC